MKTSRITKARLKSSEAPAEAFWCSACSVGLLTAHKLPRQLRLVEPEPTSPPSRPAEAGAAYPGLKTVLGGAIRSSGYAGLRRRTSSAAACTCEPLRPRGRRRRLRLVRAHRPRVRAPSRPAARTAARRLTRRSPSQPESGRFVHRRRFRRSARTARPVRARRGARPPQPLRADCRPALQALCLPWCAQAVGGSVSRCLGWIAISRPAS